MSENTQNPLLTKLTAPGETFRIPSGGLFYEEGVLDPSVKNGEVHVNPMTAYEEILMKTPDKLFSGDAVREVFARCIPSILNPGRLFAKDVDFLLVCLRKVSYGEQLQLQYTHDCNEALEHTYTVDVNHFIKTSKYIDPTTTMASYTVTLDNDQQVTLQPIRFDDYIEMMQLSDQETTEDINELKDLMVRSMLNIIYSVDGYTDDDTIKEWLEQIPPKYMKAINNHIDTTLQWGPDFQITVACKDCGHDMDITAPLNPLVFFT